MLTIYKFEDKFKALVNLNYAYLCYGGLYYYIYVMEAYFQQWMDDDA